MGSDGERNRTSTDQVPDKLNLLKFCTVPKTIREMLGLMGLKDRETFMDNYLSPLLREKLLTMTEPDSSRSPRQKYMTTPKGVEASVMTGRNWRTRTTDVLNNRQMSVIADRWTITVLGR